MATLDALYLDEDQIARRLGQKPGEWQAIAKVLEKEGLPKPDALFGRRYWPAVVAFLDRRAGLLGLAGAPRIDNAALEDWRK